MKQQSGFSLIELVVSIVAFALISTGAVALFNSFTVNQAVVYELADANRLAKLFMADIARLNYSGNGQSSDRSQFQSVDDLDDLQNSGCDNDMGMPCDPAGEPLGHYPGFTVEIAVNEIEIEGRDAKRVQITIGTPSGGELLMDTYKFNMDP